KIKISEFFNSQIKDHYLKNNLSDDKQRGLSASKIPGTFKSVQTLKNSYAPSGRDDNDIIYHTSTGGHYNNEGNFITGYGQQARYGSMTDAIDTITAAAQSGNINTIPSKFDQKWYDKQMKNVNLTTSQKNELKDSWNKAKKIKLVVSEGKAKYTGIKQKDTSKMVPIPELRAKDTSKTTYKDTAQDKQEKRDQVKKETAKYKDTAKTGAKAGYSYGL
ncbi:TPA: hypothetical protein HA278_04090, partial [Candidatus Woesearchaeota archaeon]|nr:hypothetical protein [Candidatus Woesearchaeota archaeon]